MLILTQIAGSSGASSEAVLAPVAGALHDLGMRIAPLLLASFVMFGATPAYAFPFGLLGKAGKLAGKAAKASKASKAARVGKKTGAAAASGAAADVATKGDNVARFGDDVARHGDDGAKFGDDAARRSEDGSMLDHAQDAADLAELSPDGDETEQPADNAAVQDLDEAPQKDASTVSLIVALALLATLGLGALWMIVRMSRFVLQRLNK